MPNVPLSAWLAGCWCLALFVPATNAQSKKDPPKIEGRLIVEDSAGFFGVEAIRKAKGILGEVKGHEHFEIQFVTLKELPEAKQKEFEKLTDGPGRERFFTEFARDEARLSQARGVFVLILRKPSHLNVLCDKFIKDKGFTSADEQRLVEILLEKFRESSKVEKDEEKQALRDKGLLNAAEYVRDAYKKMVR